MSRAAYGGTFSKQGYVHLHGLMAEISEYFEEENPELYEEIDFSDYDSLDVRPTSIHKSKTDHKRAVFELLDAMTDGIEALEE